MAITRPPVDEPSDRFPLPASAHVTCTSSCHFSLSLRPWLKAWKISVSFELFFNSFTIFSASFNLATVGAKAKAVLASPTRAQSCGADWTARHWAFINSPRVNEISFDVKAASSCDDRVAEMAGKSTLSQ